MPWMIVEHCFEKSFLDQFSLVRRIFTLAQVYWATAHMTRYDDDVSLGRQYQHSKIFYGALS